MSLDHIHVSSRTKAPQGWTLVYRDDCGKLTSAQADYDPPEDATDAEIVHALDKILSERLGPMEIPDVLFVFRGRHADLVGDDGRPND